MNITSKRCRLLLCKDGLVTNRRDGQTIWYQISSGPAREVVKTLYRIYCSQAPACRPKLPSKIAISLKKRIERNQ